MRSPYLTALFALLMAWIPDPALAHRGSVCKLALEVEGTMVRLTVRSSRHGLAPTLGVAEAVNPIPALYRQKEDVVLDHVAGYISIAAGAGGSACPVEGRRLETKGEEILVRLSFRCPRRIELLRLRYDLLFDQDDTHKAILAVEGSSTLASRAAVLSFGQREFRLERHVSPWLNARDFLVLGLEHIFTGLDHVLFILGLLLAAGLCGKGADARPRGLRQGIIYLLKVVTAFTVAHSLTLMGAALELVSLPPRVVEPAIAASIIYVGLENLILGDPRRRWVIAFFFGLVHGFGFAYILADVGLPRSGLALSLLAFNLGVEAGQVTLVLLLFPVIHLLARMKGRPWIFRHVVLRGGSAAIAGLGVYWFVVRLLN